jgi:hypothetical protein
LASLLEVALTVKEMSEEGERASTCEVTPEKRVEKRKIKKGKKAAWEK